MRFPTSAAVAALIALGACDSGSNTPAPPTGGTSPTPTPTISPSPTPPPTPAPVANTNFTNITVDQTFVGDMTSLRYGRTLEGHVQFTGVSQGNHELIYFPGTSAYRIRNGTGVRASIDADPTILFSPADIVASTTDARYATYKRTLGDFDFLLKLLKPGTGNDLIALTYSSIGYSLQGKTVLTPSPTFTTFNQYSFAYGFATPTSTALPTGDGRYRGVALGGATYLRNQPQAPVYEVTGTIDITVNYATGNVSGTATLTRKDDRTGAISALGVYNVTMLDGALVLISPIGGPGGVVRYHTYGPAAEELSGAANIEFIDVNGERLYIALAFATKR